MTSDSPPRFAHDSEAELARILDFYGVAWRYEPDVFPISWNADGAVTDIIVGWNAGYRSSWQTALGAVPRVIAFDVETPGAPEAASSETEGGKMPPCTTARMLTEVTPGGSGLSIVTVNVTEA